MPENININYNPNDFFYVSVKDYMMPTDDQCKTSFNYNILTDASCIPSDDSWKDLSFNCYKRELCKNKEKSKEINNLQNNHLGSDQNYLDTNNVYMNEYIKTFNLSIGILILILTSYYMQ
jgi:hypothetical protein